MKYKSGGGISMTNTYFTSSPSVQSSRILYTPSSFARSSLLHLQEVGSLKAIKPHTSKREKLSLTFALSLRMGKGSWSMKERSMNWEEAMWSLLIAGRRIVIVRVWIWMQDYGPSNGATSTARTWALSTVSIRSAAASQYSRRTSCNLTMTSWTSCTTSHPHPTMSGTCGSTRSCPLS